MKNLTIPIICIFLFFSCNSKIGRNKIDPIKIINKQFKEYIEQNANDPKSYEPIGTYLMDTIYYRPALEEKIKDLVREIEFYKSNESYHTSQIKEDEALMKSYNQILDSLSNSPRPNPIAIIEAIHECRLHNSFGALIKSKFLIYCDTSFNIYHVSDYTDLDKWLVNPGLLVVPKK